MAELNVGDRPSKKVKVSLEMYPLDCIYRAGYYLTEVAYIIIEDIKEDDRCVEVTIIPKDKKANVDEIVLEFFNKLLIAYEELKALKRSEEVRKLLSAGVIMDTYRQASPQRSCPLPSTQGATSKREK